MVSKNPEILSVTRKQRVGFTLLEALVMCLVLCVFTLLLVGVLKGRRGVSEAKVQDAAAVGSADQDSE